MTTPLTLKVRPDLFEPLCLSLKDLESCFADRVFRVRFQHLTSVACQGLSTAKAGRAAEGQSMVSTLLRNAGSVASVSTAVMH